MSELYMGAGQYDKALVAIQRYLELKPRSPRGHYQAAWALLANYDAEQARSEFGEWFKLCTANNPEDRELDLGDHEAKCTPENGVHRYLGLAYFAEAKYADAAGEFNEYLSSLADEWLWQKRDIVFCNILALRSLNRAEEVKKLVGRSRIYMSSWQEAVSSYLQGQSPESDLLKQAESPSGNKHEAFFYIGSVYLLSGDKAKAREMFQKAVEVGNYQSDEFIAARFRLRQLSTKY